MRVHYISPFRTDKNIGLGINESVSSIDFRSDDWFVLTDHDTLWLLPDSKAQVEQILAETIFDLLGCMTNRIRSAEQLAGGVFSDDDRIREHIAIARRVRENAGNLVTPARGVLAAFMLCFRVSVWLDVGGFVPEVLNFDSVFYRRAVELEFKAGLMRGVYVFHTYRIESKNPKQATSHLIT